MSEIWCCVERLRDEVEELWLTQSPVIVYSRLLILPLVLFLLHLSNRSPIKKKTPVYAVLYPVTSAFGRWKQEISCSGWLPASRPGVLCETYQRQNKTFFSPQKIGALVSLAEEHHPVPSTPGVQLSNCSSREPVTSGLQEHQVCTNTQAGHNYAQNIKTNNFR